MSVSINNPANLVSLLVAIGTCLTALFTLLAAGAATYATWKTHKNTQAQVVKSLLDEYHSEKMREAILDLDKLLTDFKDAYPEEFIKQRSIHPTWDSSRRLVAQYFEKICILYENGLLDHKLIRAVANDEQVLMLLLFVKPLAKKINPTAKNIPCYDMLRDYHKIDESKIKRVNVL